MADHRVRDNSAEAATTRPTVERLHAVAVLLIESAGEHVEVAGLLSRVGHARRRGAVSVRTFERMTPRELRAFAARHGLTAAEARLAQRVAIATTVLLGLPRIAELVRLERDAGRRVQ